MSRSRQAYEAIRERITNWEAPPGSPLVEGELSAQLGLSRTPVREALQRLSREHLVRMVPGRGAFVTEITPTDIMEIYQMRDVLETGAARLACQSERRGEMRTFVARFEQARERLPEDIDGYYALLSLFDACLADIAGNQRLRNALIDTWSQSGRLRKLASRNDSRIRGTVDEHIEIAVAVAAGHEQDAVVAIRRHLARSLNNILSSFSRSLDHLVVGGSGAGQGGSPENSVIQ